MEALLAGFAADGMTLVMSTHNLGQAKRLATRVVYLDGGRGPRRPADRRVFQCGRSTAAHNSFLKGELA